MEKIYAYRSKSAAVAIAARRGATPLAPTAPQYRKQVETSFCAGT